MLAVLKEEPDSLIGVDRNPVHSDQDAPSVSPHRPHGLLEHHWGTQGSLQEKWLLARGKNF